MMTMPVEQEQRQVARPLNVLVPLIKEDLRLGNEAAQQAGMPYYAAAGAKLLEAKEQLKHGEFRPWVRRNFGLSPSQTTRYLGLAQAIRKTENDRARSFLQIGNDAARSFPSINAALKEIGHSGYTAPAFKARPWHDDVKENIERAKREAERLRDEELTRQQERDAERKLALRLIDIGYKVLVKELHPDKGGSRDVMARLNRVRDRLKLHV
jgi:hypothetical protein